jgi:hypothetical protein
VCSADKCVFWHTVNVTSAAPHPSCCAAGACKILFQLPLIWFILVKYAVAGGLTVIARESITAVAWDSAGAW